MAALTISPLILEMRFLTKPKHRLAEHEGLRFPEDRAAIRSVLKALQRSFCAYTECYLSELQPPDIEHFNPQLKGTEQDNIHNWHAVVHCINNRKARKIEAFLPLPDPNDPSLQARVCYEEGNFYPVAEDDIEAENLIRWIGANKPEVYTERRNHVKRLRFKLEMDGADSLMAYLRQHPEELQFSSTIEAELEIPVQEMLAGV